MELISVLEEKIRALVALLKNTKQDLDCLQSKYDVLKNENIGACKA